MAKNDPIRKYQQMSGNNVINVAATSTTSTATGNADTVDGFHASATAIGNTILALDDDGYLPTSITGDADTLDEYDAAELAVLAEAETVTGLWTFSRSTNAPFACVSGAAKVTYLDADKLDGYEASAFPRKAEAATIAGGWTFQADIQADCDLDFVGAQSITTTAGDLTIAPTGDVIFNPTGNDLLPTTNYDLNLGSLAKKYLTLHAAELWVETLVAQDTIATIGGRVLVGPTTTLTRDLASGGATIYVKHNEMASGDRAYMEANGQVEFMAITSAASAEVEGDYSYSVTRNLDGSGANDWYAGDAVFNTGAANDGWIDLYSVQGIGGVGAGPTIVGNVRQSATYNDWEPRWAIGNLNGLYGIGANNYYGVGIGDYADGNYLRYDTNGGFVIRAGDGSVSISDGGIVISAPETTPFDISSILFKDATPATIFSLSSFYVSTLNRGTVSVASTTGRGSTLQLEANSPTGESAVIYLTGASGSSETYIKITDKETSGTSTVGLSADTVATTGDLLVGAGLYVGSTATDPAADCIHLDGNLVGTTPANIADDTAISFSPANLFGSVLVTARLGTYMQLSALVVYRAYTPPFTLLLAGGTAAAVTTGALTGTTGADNKFTISAHTDGKIYLENRMGTTVSIHYICFGA